MTAMEPRFDPIYRMPATQPANMATNPFLTAAGPANQISIMLRGPCLPFTANPIPTASAINDAPARPPPTIPYLIERWMPWLGRVVASAVPGVNAGHPDQTTCLAEGSKKVVDLEAARLPAAASPRGPCGSPSARPTCRPRPGTSGSDEPRTACPSAAPHR
jgi:hypothetical protein